MIDLLSNLTAIIMLLGILVGTLVSPRIAHKIGTEFSRKDLIFKKKLEYFELILETINKNKRNYETAIKKLGASKEKKIIEEVIKELKQNRRNFLPLSSPLYFDTRGFSEKIIRFVRAEGIIFNRIASLTSKNKKEAELILKQLEEDIHILNLRGDEILSEMKKELRK